PGDWSGDIYMSMADGKWAEAMAALRALVDADLSSAPEAADAGTLPAPNAPHTAKPTPHGTYAAASDGQEGGTPAVGAPAPETPAGADPQASRPPVIRAASAAARPPAPAKPPGPVAESRQ